MEEIGKILIYGDIHLSSKNYGGHRDYARESLEYFKKITEAVEKHNISCLIGTGDFTFGRFHSLEYRKAVEDELEKQFKLTNGNRYELKGNHDSATYGMTEYEYYTYKGLLKKSKNISIGCVNINMVDNGEVFHKDIIKPDKETIDIVIAHDYLKFEDTKLPNFGNPILLDKLEKWFGIDYLFCGHVHKYMAFQGLMMDGENGHRVNVVYPGCMTRPAYIKSGLDKVGHLLVLTIYKDKMDIEDIEVPLWNLEDSFNIEELGEEFEEQEYKENRVDISDIVSKLDEHDRAIGNPEDIIRNITGVDEKYKAKAIELLKVGMS